MNLNFSLIAQAITFALFIWFTVKLIWPYMLRAIETRQKTIGDGLAAAERGHRELEASSKRADEAIAEARGRAADILAQTEKRGVQLIEEAKGTAKNEGNREMVAAKAEIEQEFARAREQLRDQVAALAVAGAEKILQREVDAKAHADLLESIRRQL